MRGLRVSEHRAGKKPRAEQPSAGVRAAQWIKEQRSTGAAVDESNFQAWLRRAYPGATIPFPVYDFPKFIANFERRARSRSRQRRE